jgi:hypothetical protein
MKADSVAAEFFHADKQTYITMLIVAFRTVANTAKNETKLQCK